VLKGSNGFKTQQDPVDQEEADESHISSDGGPSNRNSEIPIFDNLPS
jgi:hypothetical protein